MSNSIQLGNQLIQNGGMPYIIAEIGVNHEGSLEKAKMMIDMAHRGGANAVKFQSYKAEKLASINSPSYWDTTKEKSNNQFNLFKKYDSFNEVEYRELYEYCKAVGIEFLSTPFDNGAVDYLDDLVPFFKIASADITNYPLLKKIAMKSKPVVLSTGASTVDEIDNALEILRSNGCKDVALLHCVLNYPTEDHNAHLLMIKGLISRYPDLIIGYSDHTLPDEPMVPLITAFLLGAMIIEKHFTYDKTLPGNDHYHAMDEKDLSMFVANLQKISLLMGNLINKVPLESELLSIANARRSIVVNKKLNIGHVLSESDLISKRPGHGISPLSWNKVIGMIVARNMDEDDILQWSDVSEK